MSIPVRFRLYDAEGNYLKTSGFMTRSYGSKSAEWTTLQKRLADVGTADIIKYENVPTLKYIVCTESIDYMIDVETFEILPNKFEE
jgi:hypothetical protein